MDYKSLENRKKAEEKISAGKQEPELPSKSFLVLFFFIMGFQGIDCFFVLLAESDYFNEQYPRFLYYFWSIIPSNIAIPFSFLAIKSLSWMAVGAGNIISTFLNWLFLFGMIFPAYYFPDDIKSKDLKITFHAKFN